MTATRFLPGFVRRASERLALHYYWNYTLPRTTEATIGGVQFDLSGLSVLMRNRILQQGYESHETTLCKRYLNPEDVVLELGAGIGFVGLLCQKIIGIQRYAMVEANPATIELLKRNYALNGLTPQVWNRAISQCDGGEVLLNINGEFVVNTLVHASAGPEIQTVKVPSTTLTAVLARVPETNVLIVDIEGAEQFIDFDSIPETINKIIIELHPDLIGYEATFEIISRLSARGFGVADVDRFDKQAAVFALLRRKEPPLRRNPTAPDR